MDNITDKGQQTIVVVNSNSPVLGILSILFSIIGIFVLAIVFVPLGLIFGIIALFKKQVALGIVGIVLAIIAAFFSPTFWGLFSALGLASMGAIH